jgi:hypothetical protein
VTRIYAIVVSMLMCGAVLSPLHNHFHGWKQDGFPLSWYPMFRGTRPEVEKPKHVIGRDRDGNEHKLNYRYWARGGFNQGRNQLSNIVNRGRSARKEICEKIAEKIGKSKRKFNKSIVQVQVVQSHYSRINYFQRGITSPIRRRVYASCAVPGREAEAEAMEAEHPIPSNVPEGMPSLPGLPSQ